MKNIITQIILGMMFLLLIELISPENSNKKYISTACTFLVVTAVLSPFLNKITDFSESIDNAIYYINEFDVNSYRLNGIDIYSEMLNLEFENKLQMSFYNLLKENNIDFEGTIEFNYVKDTESENFGCINDITVSYTVLSEYDNLKLTDLISNYYEINKEKIFLEYCEGT